MKRLTHVIVILTILSVFLGGCLYPQERKLENQIPYEDQLQSVQNAVNRFQSETGVLPILNRDQDTPIYQKYPIDFRKLIPQYLQAPPGNAYENGGAYQYVLTNVETNATVKLIDLTMIDEIHNYQFRLNQYRRENNYLPFKEIVAENIYILDHNELGYDTVPQVKSAITGQYLPFIVNGHGEIFVDYSIDLYQFMQEYEYDYEENEDIRDILVENSPFVPVYSVPYTVIDNEPVFLTE